MARKLVIGKEFVLRESVARVIEKRVTKFGCGAKVDCPKEFLGKRAYIVIVED